MNIDEKYKGHHTDENGLFKVSYCKDQEIGPEGPMEKGWYWATDEDPDNVEGPYKTSYDAWLAATNLDFSINH